MSDSEQPDSTATAQPTFKKRKARPQSRTLSLREASGTPAPSEGSTREGTPGSGFDEEEGEGASETLDSLLALRRLKRSTAGLDLERLNAGEKKKRPKVVAAPAEGAEVTTAEGMIEGTQGGLRAGGAAKDRIRDDADAPAVVARKLVKSDNFTGQTNTVDVDKHMLAYIDAELARKRGPSDEASTAAAKPLDPRDDLYKVADKYKFEDVAAIEAAKKAREEEEGNVTLSASMLMGIPEVDLGIDTKLKNIEATEKAKRDLFDQQQERRRAAAEAQQDEFAVDRFYRHRRPLESDGDALGRARAEAAKAADPATGDPDHHLRTKTYGQGRKETATDEMAMARFKKRQQHFK